MQKIQESFSKDIIVQVWEKATIVSGQDSNKWRKDYADAWICRSSYGKTTDGGWEIDHQNPTSNGGTDDLENLVPLHWKNNRTKSADYPKWQTSITSKKSENIEYTQNWEISE